MKFLLILVSFLPALNADPVPGGPHGDVYYQHTIDIQGRVGCSVNGAFLPMSAVQVYLSKQNNNYLDMHVSNEDGWFRVNGISSKIMSLPSTFIGIVLSCDALAFEKQFQQCNLSCPSGKSLLVRKQISFNPANGNPQTATCQLDLDLAQGTTVDHEQHQELLPTVYVPKEQDQSTRPACSVL